MRSLLLGVIAATACRGSRPSGGVDPPRVDAAASVRPATTLAPPVLGSEPVWFTDAAIAERLCSRRPRCSLRQRRPISGAEHTELVTVAFGREPGKEGCDGAEYWLLSPSSVQQIASDCDQQDGADALSHAETSVAPGMLQISYEEGRSSDGCAGLSARFLVPELHLAFEDRWLGSRANHRCTRQNEITTDWDSSDHLARWRTTRCDVPTFVGPPALGAAIPRVQLADAPSVTSVGSCAVAIDATRAGRWQKKAVPLPPRVALHAVVLNDVLLIDVEAATAGSLSVIVASDSYGALALGEIDGCQKADDYRISVTTLNLEGGQSKARGPQALALRVIGRDDSRILVASASVRGVARIGLSYASPSGARLESANLSAQPIGPELPPLDSTFSASDPCQVVGGKLEVRRINDPRNPALEFQKGPG